MLNKYKWLILLIFMSIINLNASEWQKEDFRNIKNKGEKMTILIIGRVCGKIGKVWCARCSTV